jgi:hypothetical protein
MTRTCSCIAAVLTAALCRSQTVFVPKTQGPTTEFRYKCVLPKGWVPGPTAETSFLEASYKGQPVFHKRRGLALMSFFSAIVNDVKLVPQQIALYEGARKHGCAIVQEHALSGELYAFFMNTSGKPLRMPALKRGASFGALFPANPKGSGGLLEPRHYAQLFVINGKRIFRITFSSSQRDMVSDALAVARSFRPVRD